MASERTTIRELARLSGVSIGTVSRALNGYADVQPGHPRADRPPRRGARLHAGASARTLVTQRSHVVGVFLDTGEGHPDLQHPFFHEVLAGVQETAGAAGLRPAAVRDRAARQRLRPPQLRQALPPPQRRRRDPDGRRPPRRGGPAPHRVDDPDDRRRRPADRRPRHLLRLAPTTPPAAAWPSITLRRLGIGGSRRSTARPRRSPASTASRATARPSQQHGLAYRDEYVVQGDFYVDSGHAAAARLLDLARAADRDRRGVGPHGRRRDPRRRRARACSSPRDLSVIGFDDIMLAAHLQPGLTTLRQDKAGLGAAAARAVLALAGAERRRRRGGDRARADHAARRARRPRHHRRPRWAGKEPPPRPSRHSASHSTAGS